MGQGVKDTVWPCKVFNLQCWELLELLESRAMSFVFRKLLLEDGGDGGGTSKRETRRGQDGSEEAMAGAMVKI